jgi:glucose 1-dehydrogenase
MIGLVVTPGAPDSMRLEEATPPHIDGQDSVLVRTLEVGVCGTDRTIRAGGYGTAPAGADRLVVGHEAVGVVERPRGPFQKGDLVAPTVRRPCGECSNCAAGEMDACTTGRFLERGILGLHGFASEVFAERFDYLVPIPRSLARLGVLAEPASIAERGLRHAHAVGMRQGWEPRRAIVLGVGAIGMLTVYLLRLRGIETWAMARRSATSTRAELVRACGARYVSTSETTLTELASEIGGPDLIMEAAGSPELIVEAMKALGINGVLCVRGIDANRRPLEVDSTLFTEDLVLYNKSVIGSTNAGQADWPQGVRDLESIAQHWPDALPQIVGLSVPPDRFAEALEFRDGVKATISFS